MYIIYNSQQANGVKEITIAFDSCVSCTLITNRTADFPNISGPFGELL